MSDLEELKLEISTGYGELYDATEMYRTIAGEVIAKKNEIDIKKVNLYDEGMINGKNAESRDAQVKFYLNEDFEQLLLLETKEANARLRVDLANIYVEKLRALLRVEEVIASKGLDWK